jgi:hypothetical protein
MLTAALTQASTSPDDTTWARQGRGWGLAANGQAGVENVLDLLRSGLDSSLLGLGHSSIAELNPSDLVIPDGFTRRLGE